MSKSLIFYFFLVFLLRGISPGFAATDPASKLCSAVLSSFSANNRNFYNLAGDWLDGLSERKGISRGEDLEAIRSIIGPILEGELSNVLEIGAGRGRVIRWLLENFPHVAIVGVDQSERTAEILSQKFQHQSNVNILNSNILDLNLRQQVSLALWMWSGFAEISAQEKPQVLRRVFQNLMPSGVFVIDMPREIVGKEKIVHGNQGVVELQESFATLMAHVVTDSELKALAQDVGFEYLQTLNYETSTNIQRASFVFRKPSVPPIRTGGNAP